MNDFAVLILEMDVKGLKPLKLYNGKDTEETTCQMLELDVSTYGSGPAVEEVEECDDKAEDRTGYSGVIGKELVCIKEKPGATQMLDGKAKVGTPLLARAGEDEEWMLVGLSMGGTPKFGQWVFSRTADALQWIYAHNITAGGPRKPMEDVKLKISKLTMEGDATLNVSIGPSTNSMAEGFEPCDVPVEKTSMGGALTLEIKMPAKKDSFSVQGSMKTPPCEGAKCMDCKLYGDKDGSDDKWSAVLGHAKKGLAFTGGLGKKSESSYEKEYGVWACAKDWNVEEQIGCGAAPGDLHCFRFNEKEDEFDDYGGNKVVKLVKAAKETEGDQKYKNSIKQF